MTSSTLTIPTLLRPTEVHRRYNIPRNRLYDAIRRGELRAINMGTPRRPSFLIRITDLEAWLELLTSGGRK